MNGVDPPTQSRAVELVDALAAVRDRIHTAAGNTGRSADEVTLIAVTKTYPATDAAELLRLGVGDLGENRVDDLRAKAVAVPAARWHVIGQLQTNKVGKVIGLPGLTAIHSIDRPSLVAALGSALARRDERTVPLDCFVQVDLDPDPRPGRGGARPTEVAGLAAAVADTAGLRLAGVMAVAPLGGDPGNAFAELARISALVRADHPHAAAVSAGMSNDFEVAIRHGATHVRVGTALLGPRTPLR